MREVSFTGPFYQTTVRSNVYKKAGKAYANTNFSTMNLPSLTIHLFGTNLRHDLVALRKALGVEAGRIASPARDTLTMDFAGAEVDIIRFDTAMQAGNETALRQAVEVYSGPLLESCYAIAARSSA
jgi:hypothetical protein